MNPRTLPLLGKGSTLSYIPSPWCYYYHCIFNHSKFLWVKEFEDSLQVVNKMNTKSTNASGSSASRTLGGGIWVHFPSSQQHICSGIDCLPSLALCVVAAGTVWAQYTSRVWIPPPQTGPVTCQWGSCCSRRRDTWHSFHSEVLQEYLFGLIHLKEEEAIRKIYNFKDNKSDINYVWKISSRAKWYLRIKKSTSFELLNPFLFPGQSHNSLCS